MEQVLADRAQEQAEVQDEEKVVVEWVAKD